MISHATSGGQAGRWFIGDEDIGTMHNGARYRGFALLSAGNLTGEERSSVLESHQFKRICRAGSGALSRATLNLQSQRHVFRHRFTWKKLEVLKDNAKTPPQ